MRANYWVYSGGLVVVWVILLAIRLAVHGGTTGSAGAVLFVFVGFAIAWGVETLAREIFAPPARWRDAPAERSMVKNYWVFSAGTGIVWIIILAVSFAADGINAAPVLYVFAGYAIGWVSGTIARYVYPPPAKWRGRRAVA